MAKWESPVRPEARIWLDIFNERLGDWLRSERADAVAAGQLTDALRNLLERAPDSGTLVASLATTLLHQHADVLGPDLAAALAGIGLTAERLMPERRPLTRAWLTVERGRSALEARRFLDASRDRTLALEALDGSSGDDADLHAFVRAKAQLLGASALDALLDYGAAGELYRAADEIATRYGSGDERFGRLLAQAVVFFYGAQAGVPEAAVRAELQLLWREVATLRIATAAGAARCAAFAVPGDLSSALETTQACFRSCGLSGVSPLELGLLVRWAEPGLAADFVETVVEVARGLDLPSEEFEAVLYAAAACGAGDGDGAVSIGKAAHALGEVQDLVVAAAAAGFMFVWESSRQDNANAENARAFFFEALDILHAMRDERLDDPRLRATFDEPVALALRALGESLKAESDSTQWTRLARLIDFELAGRSPIDHWLPPHGVPEDLGADLALAADLLDDRIARLRRALRDWPEATALIMRAAGSSLLLICVSGECGVTVTETEAAYGDAADELVAVLERELAAVELTGSATGEDAFVGLGQAAYRALPESVRARLEASEVVLVCPDHRTGGDAVPYELFHDGTGWLGTEKVVARLPSLRALVRSAEATARSDRHRRLLALAVPEPPGDYEPLSFAPGEVTQVREFLVRLGWDAPPIEPDRISPGFVVERLPFVTHLHLATHGEAEGAEDALILAGGERLSSTDIAARFFPRVPSAYVNACSLATTRWVGGGKSRGVGHAFLEAGSPAVVANLLPVEDARSSELAAEFYRAAASLDIGESLRRARSAVRASSSPVFWGSTVLIGDPRWRLAPSDRARSLSEQLLETMFGGEQSEEIRLEATDALVSDPADVRLAAAAALMREIASWGSTADVTIRDRIAAACRVAVELDHLPAAGLTAFLLADTYDKRDDPDEARRVLEGVIELLEPLEQEDGPWKSLLDRLLARWMLVCAGERAPTIGVSGAAASEEDELRGLGEAVRDAQLAVEARNLRRGRASAPREAERSADDVMWNAVFANRTLQLESMPEIAAFGAQVAEKLARLGELDAEALPTAGTAITGLLKWLWDSQSVVALPAELAQGQAGTLAELLRSIKAHWPPADAPWFDDLRRFSDDVPAELAALENLPYDDELYPAIEAVMGRIKAAAEATFAAVAARDPQRSPDAKAWILGVLIERNTYSWVDGSVPEGLEERLRGIHDRISADAESAFLPWLGAGFQAVRNAELDELERWKLEPAR